MNSDNKKVGIITFHASHNCGSMLQAYALQCFLQKNGYNPEMVNFSSEGQKNLYSLYNKNKSLKFMVRNFVFHLHSKRLKNTRERYEAFKKQYFKFSDFSTSDMDEICADNLDYYAVIAGADQVWNTTISDYDDAYFLYWVKNAKRIAYAPSFGAKNPLNYAKDINKIKQYLNDFNSLSIRENNGQRWINELIGEKVPVVLDPTLIIDKEDYEKITAKELNLPEKYIFYYSPSYSLNINKLVKKISKKYKLPVIAFNGKAYYLRGMELSGFKLPDFEDPTSYLQLMKNAAMIITTSFHGSIFSTLYHKKFWVIKNGGMFGDDDRVRTLLSQLNINERLISSEFDDKFDYMQDLDYEAFDSLLKEKRAFSENYLLNALKG